MANGIEREDWERILFALSSFRHNPVFRETYDKVRNILEGPGSE